MRDGYAMLAVGGDSGERRGRRDVQRRHGNIAEGGPDGNREQVKVVGGGLVRQREGDHCQLICRVHQETVQFAFVVRGPTHVDGEALGEVDGRVAWEGGAGVDGDWELQQVAGHEYAESAVADCDEGDGDVALVEVGDRFEVLRRSRFKHAEAVSNGRI